MRANFRHARPAPENIPTSQEACVAQEPLSARSRKVDSASVRERVHAGLTVVDKTVEGIARSLEGVMETDDLIAYGRVGLLGAARRFDPKHGLPFELYATFRVRGAIIDAVRHRLGRSQPGRFLAHVVPIAARSELSAHLNGAARNRRFRLGTQRVQPLDVTLAELASSAPLGVVFEVSNRDDVDLVDRDSFDPEQALANAQLRALLLRSIKTLPPDEAELIRRHYFDGESFDRVALDLAISRAWASRLQSRAIKRLGKRVRALGKGVATGR
jgi:RNA polymerase sigma factor for flagellar operon FliA